MRFHLEDVGSGANDGMFADANPMTSTRIQFDAPQTVEDVMNLMKGITKTEASEWLMLETERQVYALEDNLSGDNIKKIRAKMHAISSKYETNPEKVLEDTVQYVITNHLSHL